MRALIVAASDAGVPTLGICLGHQLAAVALGGRVTRNPNGKQRGLTPIGFTPEVAGDPLFGPSPDAARGVHSNNDVVIALPHGAAVIAHGGAIACVIDRAGAILCRTERIEPGRTARFPGLGARASDRAGWCVAFADGAGLAGCPRPSTG